MKAKYIFKMIEQLKQKYGFNFKNVETFEDVETVLEDKGFQFYDNRVIDFFKYKTIFLFQPHVPVRLPCYDFILVIDSNITKSLPKRLTSILRLRNKLLTKPTSST